MAFQWSLSDSKLPKISETLLSILAVWMVSTPPLVSKSFSPCINLLVTVTREPITIGIIVTFMFQFFQFPRKVEVFILLFTFFQFSSVVSRDSEVHNSAIFVDYSVWSSD